MENLCHLSDERSAEKCPEGHEKVAAGDAGQVEEGVGDGGAGEDPHEAHPLHQLLHPVLGLEEEEER